MRAVVAAAGVAVREGVLLLARGGNGRARACVGPCVGKEGMRTPPRPLGGAQEPCPLGTKPYARAPSPGGRRFGDRQ